VRPLRYRIAQKIWLLIGSVSLTINRSRLQRKLDRWDDRVPNFKDAAIKSSLFCGTPVIHSICEEKKCCFGCGDRDLLSLQSLVA
jgi:hypothetical protein